MMARRLIGGSIILNTRLRSERRTSSVENAPFVVFDPIFVQKQHEFGLWVHPFIVFRLILDPELGEVFVSNSERELEVSFAPQPGV